jgi:hypothetical protein
MTFKEFWPQYLRAHSLPGTRSLHYFASVIGLLSVADAIVARQPFLLIGIGLGYAIAIGAHKFIERNRPMIRVNAFWGMVADVRMCWLALTGGLRREIDRSVGKGAPVEGARAARGDPKRLHLTPVIRAVLLGVAALGLAAGLLDVGDLFETAPGLHYPLIQIGAPIAAFAGALFFGVAAMARSFSALSHGAQGPMSPAEDSLWRASIALLAFGGLALMLAELAEHGTSGSAAAVPFGALTSLIAITPGLLIGESRPPRDGRVAPRSRLDVLLAKGIGGVGSAICFITAAGILCWQMLRWVAVGWQPVPVRAVFGWLGLLDGSPMKEGLPFGWPLEMSGVLAALIAAMIFAIIGLRAAAVERRRNETWLFHSYMDEARGSGAARRLSGRG